MILQMPFPPIDERPHREAKTLIRMGHDVHLFCRRLQAQPETGVIDGIVIHRVASKEWLSPWFSFLLPLIIRIRRILKEKPDVIHIHNPHDTLIFVSYLCGFFHRHKVVFDIHDPVPLGFQQNPSIAKKFLVPLAEVFERIALKRADRVIVVSEGSKERLLSMGEQKEKIVVLRNFVDLEVFDKTSSRKDVILRQLNLSGKRVILYPGALSPIRGVDVLIDAFVEVKKCHSDAALVIIGNYGPYWLELKRKIDSLQEKYDIRLLPWQPYESMPDFIAVSYICVEPRKYSYHTALTGNPNKLYQFMAMEKPIVATDVPSITDFVKDKETAIIVKPGDVHDTAKGLIALFDNPEYAARLARNAYQLTKQKYTWELESRKLIGLYSSIERNNA